MPGEDESRGKEREALRTEAEKRLGQANEERARIVADAMWPSSLDTEEDIFKYVKEDNPELLKFAQAYPLREILMKLNLREALL